MYYIRTHKFIPAITGRRSITDVERELFALPCKLGGLGIPNPTIVSDTYYNTSLEISAPLVQLIIECKYQYSSDVELEQNHIKYSMKKRKREQQNDNAMNWKPPDTLKRAMELAKEKGSSSWLTALPWSPMGLLYTRVPSEMRCVSGMGGNQNVCLHGVTVVMPLLPIMHSIVREVLFQK